MEGMTSHESWSEIHRRLTARAGEGLSAEELDALADALFWLDRPQESAAVWHQAYLAHRERGEVGEATMAAWRAFYEHLQVGEHAVANGWLERMRERTVERRGSREAGYVALAEAAWAHVAGDLDRALACCTRAVSAGSEYHDPNLTALAAETRGRLLIARGDVADGIAQLDAAMLTVVGGDLDPLFTGWIYCEVLSACRDLADLARAAEWARAVTQWCDALAEGRVYAGICRVHQVELDCLHGDWARAEEEIARACEELLAVDPRYAGEAHYVAGELHRLRGEETAAEAAYRTAHELGRDPQPGLALLRLAQGDVDAALASLREVSRRTGDAPLPRARTLSALVQAALAAGEVPTAEAAVVALGEVAAGADSTYLRAVESHCRGSLLLAEGNVEEAAVALRTARGLFTELSMPRESAVVGLLAAHVAHLLGDLDGARLERDAARATLTRLGAHPDLAAAAGQGEAPDTDRHGLTERELEVLGLVARGRTDREVAADLVLSEHTVARHMSNIRAKLGVPTRAAATAYAYTHGLLRE